MLRLKRKEKPIPILLNLTTDVLEQVDAAVKEQGVSRTRFIRQSIERNLHHYRRCERHLFARMYREGVS